MKSLYTELAERIRGEIPDLDRVVSRVLRSWNEGQRFFDRRDIYLDSVSLNLHGFYSGIERLFELIARHVDGDLPTGKNWHHTLLHQMATDVKEIRPAYSIWKNSLTKRTKQTRRTRPTRRTR